MSNFSDWPTCAECTHRREAMGNESPWAPVEEYGVEVDMTSRLLLSSYSVRVVVVAACSHGHGPGGWERHAQKQSSEPIDCPIWWNVDRDEPLKSKYLQAAIRSLTFFKPGDGRRPAHRMVTLVT